MTIKTIIELRAKLGQRTTLVQTMDNLFATMRDVPGFRGMLRYEVLDEPDKLIEIAEWDSPDTRQVWLTVAMASGVLKPLMEILATPISSLNVRKLNGGNREP
jgi:quinol monooxygenase YgiN